MGISVKEKTNVTILNLRGKLDLSGGHTLKERLKLLLAKDGLAIHLNLADVELVGSSGLGPLVSIMQEIRLRRGRLTLSNLTSYMQEVFDITQLSHVFEIYATEHEALDSHGGGQ